MMMREQQKARAEAIAMIERDNLKIKTLAKYKTLKTNQMQAFLNIEKDEMDLAYCKGKAFSDSSMEEKEREIESEHEERGIKNSEFNYGRNSQNSELNGSIHSDDDYWQELGQ